MTSEPIISVKNLGKRYWLYSSVWRRLCGCFISPQIAGAHPFEALEGLHFELYPGEAIALIGQNGAGKSTALQVLAGITPPSAGSFSINGRVCALLELGSGFNPEFTGRQNISLAGALMGLTREEIKNETNNIINFADIGEFINQPVKFYSSGMFVRLAFAVAVAGQPDLIIIDEALAVGDIFFRQKCYARLQAMRDKGMAVILVTHSSSDAMEFCNKAILLEKGKQTYNGNPKEAMSRYYFSIQKMDHINNDSNHTYPLKETLRKKDTSDEYTFPWPEIEQNFTEVSSGKQQHTPGTYLHRFYITDDNNKPTNIFQQGASIHIYMEFNINLKTDIISTGSSIFNDSGIAIYSKSSIYSGIVNYKVSKPPAKIYSHHKISLNIACGEYVLACSLSEVNHEIVPNMPYCDSDYWTENSRRLANAPELTTFSVVLPHFQKPSRVKHYGLVDLPSNSEIIIQESR